MMSREAMKLALETSEGIVNADWRKWDELASPSEFERWAKSRANFMATILREALAEQPAQRTWVGLTDEDKHYLNDVLNLQGRFPVIDAIEAKLRSKNEDRN